MKKHNKEHGQNDTDRGKAEVLREKSTGLGYGAVYIDVWRPTFRMSLLPPSSGQSTLGAL